MNGQDDTEPGEVYRNQHGIPTLCCPEHKWIVDPVEDVVPEKIAEHYECAVCGVLKYEECVNYDELEPEKQCANCGEDMFFVNSDNPDVQEFCDFHCAREYESRGGPRK